MRLAPRRAHSNNSHTTITETWETPMKGITRRVMLLAAFVAVAGIAACKHKGEGGPPSDTGASYDEDADTSFR